jgi:hypothetical protein
MKHLITALAIAAGLAASTGSASATELTSPAGTTYGGTIRAETEGGITFDGSLTFECSSSIFEAEIEQQGSAQTATGPMKSWTITGCNKTHITVIKPGTIEIHTDGEGANGNGIITSSGAEITVLITLPFSIIAHCITETNETVLGTITGSINSGATAKVGSAPLPDPTDLFCHESQWTANYQVTSPHYLDVD